MFMRFSVTAKPTFHCGLRGVEVISTLAIPHSFDSQSHLAGDKAYSSSEIRQQLRKLGTTPIIPRRSNQKRRGRLNRGLYRERNRVERLINQLKQYRRIATRYKKYAVNYLAMLMIGAIRLWL